MCNIQKRNQKDKVRNDLSGVKENLRNQVRKKKLVNKINVRDANVVKKIKKIEIIIVM